MEEHEAYHVCVSRDDLVFSAGHFITLVGNVCECLHGHDFRVRAEVHGPLGKNHYVVDFVALHALLKEIVGELDHRVLLPTGHPRIRVEAGEKEVCVRFDDRRWIFPRSDCVLLPLSNTTAELLARHVATRLRLELEARGLPRPTRLKIAIDECFGQTAVFELGCE